jgi:hypothetical protein
MMMIRIIVIPPKSRQVDGTEERTVRAHILLITFLKLFLFQRAPVSACTVGGTP